MLLAIVTFLAALAVALSGGRRGLRALVVCAIVLAPIRGGLLEIAGELSLSEPGLTVNALVPALVAAIAIGCLVQKRPSLSDFPQPLLIGWVLIAAVTLISYPARVVGLNSLGV